jgi:DNA-binding transcriptional regulator YiaG
MWKTKALAIVAGTTFALLLPGAPAQAQATRTWVSGVGDDANPCSRTAPCKTWAGAISKTASGGEIDALDPGGFGALTITKSITLDRGGGQIASVLVAGTNDIAVAAQPTDVVILRNLGFDDLPGTSDSSFITLSRLLFEPSFGTGTTDVIRSTPVGPSTIQRGLSLEVNSGTGIHFTLDGIGFTGLRSLMVQETNSHGFQHPIDFSSAGGRTSAPNVSDEALVFRQWRKQDQGRSVELRQHMSARIEIDGVVTANIIAISLAEALKALRSGSLTGPEQPPTPAELKEIRAKFGLSQEQFARKLGVTVATLQSWEIGRRRPGRMAQANFRREFAE